MDQPTCGKCGKVMTPENARLRPELFLHDACLPTEWDPSRPPKSLSCIKGHELAEYLYHQFGNQIAWINPFPPDSDENAGFEEGVYTFTQK